MGTGCCLFSNSRDADLAVLFGEAPFEFRIETEPTRMTIPEFVKSLRDGPLKTWMLTQPFAN